MSEQIDAYPRWRLCFGCDVMWTGYRDSHCWSCGTLWSSQKEAKAT